VFGAILTGERRVRDDQDVFESPVGSGGDSRGTRRRIFGGEAAMRVLATERVERWTRGLGLVALVVMVWSVFVPGALFWGAILAAGLVGSTVATALLVRSRRVPSLAQVIASAEAEAAVGVGAGRGRP
jgi:hypothetical protein